MKKLKNWDNKTWLSSITYISEFNKFLNENMLQQEEEALKIVGR